jgi:hypothetical protein
VGPTFCKDGHIFRRAPLFDNFFTFSEGVHFLIGCPLFDRKPPLFLKKNFFLIFPFFLYSQKVEIPIFWAQVHKKLIMTSKNFFSPNYLFFSIFYTFLTFPNPKFLIFLFFPILPLLFLSFSSQNSIFFH